MPELRTIAFTKAMMRLPERYSILVSRNAREEKPEGSSKHIQCVRPGIY
jgi:hypothetical protein